VNVVAKGAKKEKGGVTRRGKTNFHTATGNQVKQTAEKKRTKTGGN